MNIFYKRTLSRSLKSEYKNNMCSYKWCIVLVIFLFVNYNTLITLNTYSINSNTSFNILDYILYTLNDSVYYTYLYIPLSVFLCISMIISNSSNYHLIRYGCINEWLLKKIIGVYLNAITFVMILLITVLSTSLLVNYEISWSSLMYNTEYLFSKDILNEISPIVAVLGSVIQLIFSISIFNIIVVYGYSVLKSKIGTFIPALIMWVCTMISLRTNKVVAGWIDYLYLDNMLIFSNYININKFNFFISIIGIILATILMIKVCKWNFKNKDLYIGNKNE